MRLLFLGDVVGRSGRTALIERLPSLRDEWSLDFVVVNGENATGGLGITLDHARLLLDAGADCLTLGDHAFDQKDMLSSIQGEPRIIRPLNFAKSCPGQGYRVFEARGRRVLVVQALGQVFMRRPFADPYLEVDRVLQAHRLGGSVDAIVLDFHAEATSEKNMMGHWCDGRVSLVAGTHTHIPTADAKVLGKGTAYITDAGMCGDYDSVIGMDIQEPMARAKSGMPKEKMTPGRGEATLCGVFVETDSGTGLAGSAVPVRVGGILSQSGP